MIKRVATRAGLTALVLVTSFGAGVGIAYLRNYVDEYGRMTASDAKE